MKKIIGLLSVISMYMLTVAFVATDKWQIFETNDYSILFPQKVKTERKEIDSEVGKLQLDITMYDASGDEKEDNLIYGLFTTTYPDSIMNSDKKEILPKFFRGAIDGAVKNVQGKLLSEEEISLNDFPGREIRVDYRDGFAVIKMRCYLVHNVLYMIQTITLTEKEKNTSASYFLNSFKLKQS